MDRTPAQRLIDLYNEHYEKIFMAAQRKGHAEALRRDVAAFFSGSTGLAEVFRGLTFGDDGKLPCDGIIQNLERIRVARKVDLLVQALSGLRDFLLFSAMQALDPAAEQARERREQEILGEIPRGEDEAESDQPAGDEPRFVQPSDVDPTSPSERTPVTMVPYLPDAQAYELASMLSACRSDVTLALERAEQIASLAGSDELREIALRCGEHAASAIHALDALEQCIQRLRRR